MKKFIAGLIAGMFIAGGVAYASLYTRSIWIDRNGNELGTTSNPIYAEAV